MSTEQNRARRDKLGITEDDRERMREFASGDVKHASLLKLGGGKGRVDGEECGEIRRAYKSGERRQEIAERYGIVTSTVRYHAVGECTHDIEEPPAEAG